MLRFVSDHLKTKKRCKYAVKKLPFVIRNAPDLLCNKAILENGGMLKFVPNCYKYKKIIIKLSIIMHMH